MAKTPETVEEIEARFKLREFGVCAACKQPLNYGDKFIDVTKGSCGSSQGYPCAYMKGEQRFHLNCYNVKKTS